jgi:hypothetical protein
MRVLTASPFHFWRPVRVSFQPMSLASFAALLEQRRKIRGALREKGKAIVGHLNAKFFHPRQMLPLSSKRYRQERPVFLSPPKPNLPRCHHLDVHICLRLMETRLDHGLTPYIRHLTRAQQSSF